MMSRLRYEGKHILVNIFHSIEKLLFCFKVRITWPFCIWQVVHCALRNLRALWKIDIRDSGIRYGLGI